MAEFPNLGQQCTEQDCKQLDFLPTTCSSCQKVFCNEHFYTHTLECTGNEQTKPLNINVVSKPVRFSCDLEGCTQRDMVAIECTFCNKQFCLKHRHAVDHKCPSVQQAPSRVTVQVADSITNAVDVKLEALAQKGTTDRDKKAARTAAKLQLMKLKMKSEGKSMSEEERVYFMVYYMKKNVVASKGIFVSKNWSLGRVIDVLADFCKLENNNNVANAAKLHIFNYNTGLKLSANPSTIVSSILDDVIYSGQNIVIDYDPDCSNLLNTIDRYKGINK